VLSKGTDYMGRENIGTGEGDMSKATMEKSCPKSR